MASCVHVPPWTSTQHTFQSPGNQSQVIDHRLLQPNGCSVVALPRVANEDHAPGDCDWTRPHRGQWPRPAQSPGLLAPNLRGCWERTGHQGALSRWPLQTRLSPLRGGFMWPYKNQVDLQDPFWNETTPRRAQSLPFFLASPGAWPGETRIA